MAHGVDSDSQRIRIWIHWQIEWSGFVGVVGSDVIMVALCNRADHYIFAL